MATEVTQLYGFIGRENDLRRVPQDQRKTPEIKQLWQRHHEIVNLSAQGYSNADIAYILGIAPVTVSNTLNSTLGMEKLADIREERDRDAKLTVARIKTLRDRALTIFQRVLEGEDESGNPIPVTIKDQLHAADVVTLELSGMRAPTVVKSHSISTTLTSEELSQFRERALNEAKLCGIIDVTAEDSSES